MATPQAFLKRHRGKKMRVVHDSCRSYDMYNNDDLEYHLLHCVSTDKKYVNLTPITNGTTCRETFSAHIKRAQLGRLGCYYKGKLGGDLTKVNVEYSKAIGGKKPIFIGLYGYKGNKSRLKKILNEVEGVTNRGRTEIFTAKSKKYETNLVVLVAPSIWSVSQPHMSLYLQIVFESSENLPIKKNEKAKNYFKRLGKSGKVTEYCSSTFGSYPYIPFLLAKHSRALSMLGKDGWALCDPGEGIDNTLDLVNVVLGKEVSGWYEDDYIDYKECLKYGDIPKNTSFFKYLRMEGLECFHTDFASKVAKFTKDYE